MINTKFEKKLKKQEERSSICTQGGGAGRAGRASPFSVYIDTFVAVSVENARLMCVEVYFIDWRVFQFGERTSV